MPADRMQGGPLYVLSRIDFWHRPSGLPAREWRAPFALDAEDPQTGALLPGLFGLPWGEGDPKAARFDLGQIYEDARRGNWCVVRVDDENGGIPVGAGRDGDGEAAAVRFYRGAIVYRGALRGALEALIQRGADPQRMSIRLALPDDTGLALAADWGCAVADLRGVARCGDHGQALAEHGGIAVAGRKGHACATGGLAVVGVEGSAFADGDAHQGGIAVAAGHLALAEASGDFGFALATAYASRLVTGLCGTVVAMRDAETIRVGMSSVVIVCCRQDDFDFDVTPNGAAITAEAGSIVIARYEARDGSVRFGVNLVEDDEPAPGSLIIRNGADLVLLDDDWKRVMPAPHVGTFATPNSHDIEVVLGEEVSVASSDIAFADSEFSIATTGDRGIALALAKHTSAEAAAYGLAISESGVAGTGGVAIGSSSAKAGLRGIALCRGRGVVSGGMGCLLVTRNDRETPKWLHAVVGKNGIEPDKAYESRDGRLQPLPDPIFDDDASSQD